MILVTGATGSVGRPLVDALRAAGAPVRAFCRHPEKGGFPADVETVAGEMADEVAVREALRGVGEIFLLRAPGVETLWRAARAQGVAHVVFLSSGAVTAPVGTFIGERHREVEEMLAEGPARCSFLRPGAFMANAFAWAPEIRSQSAVRTPFADVATVPVDARDIADAAAHLLLHPRPVAVAAYPITGPAVLTAREQVAILGDALGRELRCEAMPEAEAREQMGRFAPAPVVEGVFALMRAAAQGFGLEVTALDGITGRPGRSFATWAEDHRAAFL